MASETVGNILCMIACLLFCPTKKKPRAETSSSAGLQRAVLRRFLADFELRQNASGVHQPAITTRPAAAAPRGGESDGSSCLHCLVRYPGELLRLSCDSLSTCCSNISPLSTTLNRRPAKPNLGLELRLNESVPRSIERHTHRTELCIQAHTLLLSTSHLLKI